MFFSFQLGREYKNMRNFILAHKTSLQQEAGLKDVKAG
jgi:hypothetical protein